MLCAGSLVSQLELLVVCPFLMAFAPASSGIFCLYYPWNPLSLMVLDIFLFGISKGNIVAVIHYAAETFGFIGIKIDTSFSLYAIEVATEHSFLTS